MANLPKLPGLNFTDPTITDFRLSHTLDKRDGFNIARMDYVGIGGRELEIHTAKHLSTVDPIVFDPSLVYGRIKNPAPPQFVPHFVQYDGKCLAFNAFFKQTVTDSPLEHYRIRKVKIIYYLADDTMAVVEPRTPNAGFDQGTLVKRAKIPMNEKHDTYTWKDLNIGKDIAIYGTVYHIVGCDLFTKEYMLSRGVVLGDPEEMPYDPYTMDREINKATNVTKTSTTDNKLRRFLEYDKRILKFDAVWDDRDSEYGEMRKFEFLYFLADDTICIKEIHTKNDGRDPFPLLLKKTKIPKIYTDVPIDFASMYLELSDAEVTEYYLPADLKVGETIFILGRKFLLYDCDEFTRNYYRMALCMEQKPRMQIESTKTTHHPKFIPPHTGIGGLEDSMQNTLSLRPQPPRKNFIRQTFNADKFLRYEMVMEDVFPEDKIRRFLLIYSLGNGTCTIYEPPIGNSGIIGGKYLRATALIKPGSDPLDPTFYTPADFYVGATIDVFQRRFVIVGADLYVFRYMEENADKFPCEVIENLRNYMYNKGYLKQDVAKQLNINLERMKVDQRSAIGQEGDTIEKKTDLEKCRDMKSPLNLEYEERKKREIREEYEKTLQIPYQKPPHGIKPIDQPCSYDVNLVDVKERVCEEPEEGEVFTPKHIDTPEEIRQKYYASILKHQQDMCVDERNIECQEPVEPESWKPTPAKGPILVTPPVVPPEPCEVKRVRFDVDVERCKRTREDICDICKQTTTCNCQEPM